MQVPQIKASELSVTMYLPRNCICSWNSSTLVTSGNAFASARIRQNQIHECAGPYIGLSAALDALETAMDSLSRPEPMINTIVHVLSKENAGQNSPLFQLCLSVGYHFRHRRVCRPSQWEAIEQTPRRRSRTQVDRWKRTVGHK
jgi:hypothetical protein